MHGVAAASVFAASGWYWRAVALPLVACSLWSSLRSSRFASLRLTAKDGLAFLDAYGTRVEAVLLPESTVFVWLVVLRFRIEGQGKGRALTLLPDQMSRDEFRTLRLWLRWNAMAGTPDEPNS